MADVQTNNCNVCSPRIMTLCSTTALTHTPRQRPTDRPTHSLTHLCSSRTSLTPRSRGCGGTPRVRWRRLRKGRRLEEFVRRLDPRVQASACRSCSQLTTYLLAALSPTTPHTSCALSPRMSSTSVVSALECERVRVNVVLLFSCSCMFCMFCSLSLCSTAPQTSSVDN